MVAVHLAGVARHRLRQPEDVGSTRAQEGIPQPGVGPQLGVVPRHAAEVVTPDVPLAVEGMHYVAIVPKPIPVALVHLADVEVESGVEAAFDDGLEWRRCVAHAPSAERAHLVVILRRGDQHGQRGAGLRHRRAGRLGGHTIRGPQGELAGARNAEGRAVALLHVLIRSLQAVRPSVVMAQVHRRRLGRPHPRGELRGGAGGVLHQHLHRVGLPEVFDAHAQPAAHIAHERKTRGALARRRKQPGALWVGALLDREAVGIELHQFEVVPHRPVVDHVEALPAHLRAVGHALTLQLRGVGVVAVGIGDDARGARAPDQWLDWLRPEAVALAGETHMAVLHLLAQRHSKRDAEAVDEVLLLVAIEEDRVHHPHRRLTRVKIEPHVERQPLAARIHALVDALELHHRTHRAGLLDGDFLDQAVKLLARAHLVRCVLGSALQDADELHRADDRAALDRHGVHQVRAARQRDRAFERPAIDNDRLAVVRDPQSAQRAGGRRRTRGRRTRGQRNWACQPGGHDRGKAAPFDGAVRPGCQRPRLHGQVLALRAQAESRAALDGALRPGNPQTHAGGHEGRFFPKPGECDHACNSCGRWRRALPASLGSSGKQVAFGQRAGGDCSAGEGGILQKFPAS